ncbi:unnamed protein product [Hyaloperonospora brassicae]|uniref:Uncharacterized protein n=1 Tax=Hyaloperonospora brassicae TaxID=162125 RepID=A0AAV0TXJ2_HYABA|nr:unnamed protein product [Hyaloperonospora brassicae]
MQSAQKSGAVDTEHDVRQPSGRPPKAPAPGPSAAHAVDRRGRKPDRRDSRHDFRQSTVDSEQHRRRLPDTLNVTERTDATHDDVVAGTKTASLCIETETTTASLVLPEGNKVLTGHSVQSPRTSENRVTYAASDREEIARAPQQADVELSSRTDSHTRSGFQANTLKDVFASPTSSSTYDEKENGPRSCPVAFTDGRATRATLSLHTKRHQSRGENKLIASKLLPTRESVNSMLTYLHELQKSETSLRKQLVTTKQHTEEELNQSLAKLNKLQETMQEIERGRELALQRLEEKEQRIRDLATKLEKAEAEQARAGRGFQNGLSGGELPSFAEEAALHTKAEPWTSKQQAVGQGTMLSGRLSDQPPSLTVAALPRHQQHDQSATLPTRTPQLQPTIDDPNLHAIDFPRSSNQSLWDPWASEGTASVTNAPPMFTISSTELDPDVAPVAESTLTNGGDHELRSVLLSPNRDRCQPESIRQQKHASSVSALDQHGDASLEPLSFSPGIGSASIPSLVPQLHQPNLQPQGKQAIADDEQAQERLAAVTLSSRSNSLSSIEAIPLADVSPSEQHEDDAPSPDSGLRSRNACPDRQDIHERASRVPLSGIGNNDQPLSSAEVSTTSSSHSAAQTSLQDRSLHAAISYSESDVDARSDTYAAPADSPSQLPITCKAKLDCSSPTTPTSREDVPPKHASLEMLLLDFFTEVDNNRLKMAKVYGKRYAGREKWLFAEFTKRYGAAKVAVLKARFDTGSGGGGDVSAATSRTDSAEAQHATRPPDAPNQAEQGRRGHPQHTQFFHPPAPDGNVEFDTGAGPPSMSAPIADPHEMDASSLQSRQVAPEVETPPSPSESLSAGAFSSRQRHSGGNVPPPSGPYSSFPKSQETSGEVSAALAGGNDGSSFKRDPFPMSQRRAEPSSHRPFLPQTGTESSDAASLGLRQRRQTSVSSQDGSGDAEPPVVTLESLLKELYKNHQPDKLKSVPAMAKQYAGKERELVASLKGKYGALSVKRLEESLDVLERAHLARLSSKAAGKRRGCFVRTVSLVFWLSLLLYFSSGVVFVSFIVLDAWECHSLDGEEQELEGAEECSVLKKELEAFTYERVADYMGQSHPDACFCSEWKARESALFANYSVEDAVNLARMVPFSPDSFGAPWVATVKAQVPSQEFVDGYVKPVVDLSLDAGSFVWTSVLELAESGMTSEELPVVEHDVGHGYGDASSLDEDGDTNEHADSHPQNAETDIDDLVGNDDADTLSMEEEEELVEDQSLAVTPGVLDQVFVEEVSDVLDEKPEIEELDTRVAEAVLVEDEEVMSDVADEIDIAAPDGVLVESEDGIPAVGDVTTITGESLPSETKRDEQAAKESTDMLEVDDTLSLEMAGSIDASEQAASDKIEARADVEATSGGAVNNLAEEDESVGDADGESAETEVADAAITESTGGIDDASETEIAVLDDAADNVAVNAAEEAPEVAVGGNVETSTDDSVAEAERVVEVEVHQEGLDLLYPERESTEEAETASGEVSDSSMHGDLLPSLASGDESSISNEETAFVSPETSTADEGSTTHTSSGADADADVTNVEPDVGVESDALEANGGHSDEEMIEASQTEHQAELCSECEFVTHDDDSSTFTDVDEQAASAVVGELPSADDDERVVETNEAGDDDPTVLDEGQEDGESEIEDDTASVDGGVVAQDVSEDAEHGEVLSAAAESDATTDGSALTAAAESDATTDGSALTPEAEVENFDDATDEMDEVGNEDTEATADRDIEVEEFARESDLASELNEESAVAEDADVPDDVNMMSAEHGREADEQVEVDEATSFSAGEDGDKLSSGKDDVSVDNAPADAAVEDTLIIEADASAADDLNQLSDEENDDHESEEIAFMLQLEDPEELLRMAERAAVAAIKTR